MNVLSYVHVLHYFIPTENLPDSGARYFTTSADKKISPGTCAVSFVLVYSAELLKWLFIIYQFYPWHNLLYQLLLTLWMVSLVPLAAETVECSVILKVDNNETNVAIDRALKAVIVSKLQLLIQAPV